MLKLQSRFGLLLFVPFHFLNALNHNMIFCFFMIVYSQPPSGLPENMRPNRGDIIAIERWLDNKLGEVAIRGQKDNITTNRCEAAHLTVGKSVPKSRNHRRNFGWRSRSAAHSMSLGVVDSVLVANSALGVENNPYCPANLSRRQLRNRSKYHKQRRKSLPYRKAKIMIKARARRIRQHYNGSGYSTGVNHPVVRHDHLYSN